MARKTKKFVAAMSALHDLGMQVSRGWWGMPAEQAYGLLQKHGLVWDSKQGRWLSVADEPADEASRLVRVRVWADRELVEDWTDDIVRFLERAGWDMVDRSEVYTCRPPKQLEGRIYLQMMPPAKG